jgi:Bacterial Ig domain/PA14 domain
MAGKRLRLGLLFVVTAVVAAVLFAAESARAAHTVSCRADLPVHPGETMTWRAFVSGGSGNYSFSWSGTDGLVGTTAVVTKSYDADGFKLAQVTVTDTTLGDQAATECHSHVVPTSLPEPPNVTPVLWVPRDVNPAPLVPQLQRVWRSIHAGFYHLYGKTFRMNPLRVIVSSKTETEICGGDCTSLKRANLLMDQAFAEADAAVGGLIPYTRAILVSAWGGGGFAGAFGWDRAHGGAGDWSLAPAAGVSTPAIETDVDEFVSSILGDYRHAVNATIAHELNHVIGWDDPHDFSLDQEPTDYEKRFSLAGPFLTETPTDVTEPTVSWSSPTAGATLSGTATVSVGASDDIAMDAVVFVVDGQFMAVDATAPFSVPFDTTLVGYGGHRLEAVAYDSAGNTTWAARDVIVQNQVPETSCSGTFPVGTFHVCYFDGIGLDGPYLGTLVDHPFPVPAPNAGWGIKHNWVDEVAFGRTEKITGVWRGTLDFPAGNYTFRFFTDDGLRVRVNDRLVIDEWRTPQVASFSTVVSLSGPTRIQIEWFEDFGGQALTFWWQPTAAAAQVTAFPSATSVLKGTRRAGGAAALAADDDRYFSVDSTTSGTRTAAWVGKFAGIPNSLAEPRITYKGKNSRSCIQTLAIRDWATNRWVQLDARTVGTTEIKLANLAPIGTAARFVSGGTGNGELWIRVRCTNSSVSFISRGDLMQLTYNKPPQ